MLYISEMVQKGQGVDFGDRHDTNAHGMGKIYPLTDGHDIGWPHATSQSRSGIANIMPVVEPKYVSVGIWSYMVAWSRSVSKCG